MAAIDAKETSKLSGVFTHGGRKSTGLDVVKWADNLFQRGALGEILLTSMDKDGTKSGFDLELLNVVSNKVSIPIIASGGAGTLEHLKMLSQLVEQMRY